MALATLSIDLEAKLARFSEDLGQAARLTEQSSARMASALGSVRTGLLALGAGVSLAGLAGMVRSVSAGVDQLNDLKDATGASIENLSALEDIAARTGTSLDTVGGALVKFNLVLKDTKPGSDAAAIFDGLGLSLDALKTMDPAEALRLTSMALQRITDDGDRARVVQELFGKSVRDVAPFLVDLAQKTELVATVTSAQADEAERFGHALSQLGKNALDASRYITGDLVAAINAAAKAYKESGFLDAAQTFVFGNADNQANTAIIDQAKKLQDTQRGITELLALEQSQRGGLSAIDKASLDTLRAKERVQRAIYDSMRAERQAAWVPETTAKLPTRPGQGVVINFPTHKPKTTAKTGLTEAAKEELRFQKEMLEAKQKYYNMLQHELDAQAASNTSMAQQVEEIGLTTEHLNALRLARLDATIAQESETMAAMAAHDASAEDIRMLELRIALLREQRSITAKGQTAQAIANETAAREKYYAVLQRDLEAQAASTASMAQQVEEIGLTTEQLNALRLTRLDATIAQESETLAAMAAHEASAEDIRLLERRIALLREQRSITAKGQIAQASADTRAEQDRASKDYAATLHSDLKGAFSAAFRDTRDPLAAFGDALANTVFTRVSAALAESMATELLGSGKSGASPGLLASLFSFEGGGSTGNGSRSGGLDGRGGFLSILHPQETVIDHTRGTSQSSAAPIINIIEAPGKGGQVSQRREGGANVIDIMVEQIKGAIAADIRMGSGAMPSAMAATYGLNRVAGAY